MINAACEVFGVDKTMIFSNSQERRLSVARGAIVLHAQESGISLEEIAKVLARDGSTISSLKRRFLAKYSHCDVLQQQVKKLREKAHQLADLQA